MPLRVVRRQLATIPSAAIAAPDGQTAGSRFFHARRRAVYAMAATHGAFGFAPVITTVILFRFYLNGHVLALDFANGPWVAGHQLLHGLSPYISSNSPAVATGEPFVYPAAAAVLLAPFALIPQAVAGPIFTVLCIGAVLLSLRVLDVKDWRVYGVVLMWPAMITGWQFANLSLPLVLGVALCWRYRDRPAVAGLLLALLVSVKVYVWPLGLWLLATRRYRAFGYAVGWGAVINLVAWAVVGFDQLSRYSALMRELTRLQEWYGYSLVALALNNGISRAVAYALAFAVAAAAAAACVALGRRGRDHAAFAVSIAVSLLATPIFWPHYYVLLAVPLAIVRPRLGVVWLLPFLMWTALTNSSRWPGSWPLVIAFGVGIIFTAVAVKGTIPRRRSDESTVRPRLRLADLRGGS